MREGRGGLASLFDDAYIVEGARTPFVDYNGALSLVSPIDLAIKAGREALKRAEIAANNVDVVICGSMAQASFDAYMLPRHVGLYCGAPIEAPALLVQRVCGTGIEAIAQAADAVSLRRADTASARRRVHEPQSDRLLYASRRLSHGPGRVQGFPVGGLVRPILRRFDGRHR